MKPYADALVKQALEETPVKKELIKTVDLGPFKHTVDTGVPIRKAAYNVLQNLLSKF
jgi:cullin-associated NEDD8-dissociated protein 1